MLIRSIGALLVAVSTSYALKDSLPFFLLSTDPINPDTLHSSQIALAASLEQSLIDILRASDVESIILVQQGGVHTDDLRDAAALPKFQQRMSKEQYKSVIQISEVIGDMDIYRVASQASRSGDPTTRFQHLSLQTIADNKSAKSRNAMLEESDDFFALQLRQMLPNSTSHIIIFSAKSAEGALAEEEYVSPHHVEMDEPPFDETMHTDLKRDVQSGSRRRRQASNEDDFQKGLGLFERYQFLSPAIFMGLTVSLLLVIILYIGISAISSLQVSYMAFNKEMGPQAQKKQQ